MSPISSVESPRLVSDWHVNKVIIIIIIIIIINIINIIVIFIMLEWFNFKLEKIEILSYIKLFLFIVS